MKTIIFFIVYLITLPIKPIALLFIQITQILSNPQKYKSNKILETNPIYEPKVPPLDARGAWISNPDHSCSRTGEIIDVNLSPKETLKRFVLADGELTRAPDGNRAVGDVSGDQLCGLLLNL